MARTRIYFKNNEFYTLDWFAQLYCNYLCITMESKGLNTYSQVLQTEYDCLDLIRKGIISIGEVVIGFHFNANSQDLTDMVGVLNDTKTYLDTLGENISDTDLNILELHKVDELEKTDWTGTPIKTKSLKNMCDLIIDLLTNENFDKQGFYTFVGFEKDNPTLRPI